MNSSKPTPSRAANTPGYIQFESWTDDVFWPSLSREFSTTTSPKTQEQMHVNISAPRPAFLKQDVTPARVTASTALTPPSDSGLAVKRHLELALPPNLTYTCGDYLVVLPLNPKETTARALRYYGLTPDSVLTLSVAGPTNLPTDTPLSAADLFGGYVELGQPASKKAVSTLASLASSSDPASPSVTALAHIAGPAFDKDVAAARTTLLDLLERFGPAGVALPLAQFLALHPPMRTRQYSISSSPLASGPSTATLTYAVLDEPSLSTPGRRHIGAASTYLAGLSPGDALSVSVRRALPAFRLPADPAVTPVVMVAAGAGLAPFRGFVQERAALMAAGKGKGLAPALLFFGCRGAGDDLYRGEFDEWERQGVVRVFRAYSREAEGRDAEGCKYVQDRVWRERGVVRELWDRGAKLYVCGRGVIGQEVGRVMRRVFVEAGVCKTDEEAERWWEGLRNERVAVDTFA